MNMPLWEHTQRFTQIGLFSREVILVREVLISMGIANNGSFGIKNFMMRPNKYAALDRREFLKKGMISLGALAVAPIFDPNNQLFSTSKPVVSIVKIKNDNIGYAVEKAVELLGGIGQVTKHKQKIMLKPNLVFDDPNCTTKPEVVKTLALLMKSAGKDVCIGEGSAAATGFNIDQKGIYFTRNNEMLDKLQQHVFDKLGYTDLARELEVPLINLHTGELVTVDISEAHYFKKLTIHHSLRDIDMLCSVPMMKTHALATVTLGLKNVVGLYPGTAYCSVRSCVHEEAEMGGSPGIAFEILDMARANKLGLTVIDGSMAMEGEGPSSGKLVKMDLIIAGCNPLATDMVAAATMGYAPDEIPTFSVAHKSGMKPDSLDKIEIRGETIEAVMRKFVRAHVVPYHDIKKWFGATEV
jgi:uncharacterized protein (DUF362 family)